MYLLVTPLGNLYISSKFYELSMDLWHFNNPEERTNTLLNAIFGFNLTMGAGEVERYNYLAEYFFNMNANKKIDMER